MDEFSAFSARTFDRQMEIFMKNIEAENDEGELAETTETLLYKINRFIYASGLIISPYQIEEESISFDGRESFKISYLRFYDLYRWIFGRKAPKQKRAPLWYYAILAYLTYHALRLFLLCYYHIILGQLLDNWKPGLIMTSNSTYIDNTLLANKTLDFEACVKAEDIFEPNLKLVQRIRLLIDKIRGIGDPMTTANEVLSYTCGCFAYIYFYLIASVVIGSSGNHMVHAVNFQNDPLAERARVKYELRLLLAFMFQTSLGLEFIQKTLFDRRAEQYSAKNFEDNPNSNILNQNLDHLRKIADGARQADVDEEKDFHEDQIAKYKQRRRSTLIPISTFTTHRVATLYTIEDDNESQQEPEVELKQPVPIQTDGHPTSKPDRSTKLDTEFISNPNHGIIYLGKFYPYEEYPEEKSLENRERSMLFLKAIVDQDLMNHIRPACLSPRTYRKLIDVTTGWFCFFLCLYFVAGVSLFYNMGFIEFKGRVMTRLRIFECQSQLGPTGTFLRDLFSLRPLASGYGRRIYAEIQSIGFENVGIILFYQALFYEFYLYLTYQICFGVAELFAIFLYISPCYEFYVAMFALTYTYRVIWIDQVHDQLNSCTIMMENYSRLRNHDASGARRKLLAKALTITYLNFSLLRMQLKQTQSLSNLLAGSILIMTITSIFASYLVFIFSSNRSTIFILATNVFSLAATNGILWSSGNYIKHVEKLFHMVNKLMGKAYENGMERSYIISLMRRQLISDSDVRALHSIQVLELEFSYEFMITLNSYLLVVFLIMYGIKLF